MSDYIRKEELFKHIKSFYISRSVMCMPTAGVAFSDIEQLPHENVRPVVYGKWEHVEPPEYDGYYKHIACSVCGEKYGTGNKSRFKFCPNCGAVMKRNADNSIA